MSQLNAYRRILAAVDGSAASAKGLREALRLARSERAQLFLLHVVDEYFPYVGLEGSPPVDVVPLLREAGRRVIARAAAAAQKQGVKAKTVLREVFGGSDAGQVVRTARVPVLLVRG